MRAATGDMISSAVPADLYICGFDRAVALHVAKFLAFVTLGQVKTISYSAAIKVNIQLVVE